MSVTIWHNPRCSKSRQTLALLQDQGIKPIIRKYLDEPPTLAELAALQKMLDLPVIAFVRTGEAAFRQTGLSKTASDDDLLAAMARHPILIERPVVFANGKAALGRPPEAILAIV